ncbi:MAG: carboxypeptidase-like regulatory domain-containing protein, partial [Robiginitalea sp.]
MRIALFLAMLLLSLGAYAQTTVSGNISDENGVPVPGVNIVILGTTVGTTADFDGNFTLQTSEMPPFELQISSIGYTSTTVTVSSNNQTLSITLAEAQTFLDEVVISASRTPERIFESPVSVERFGIRDIQNTTAEAFYG